MTTNLDPVRVEVLRTLIRLDAPLTAAKCNEITGRTYLRARSYEKHFEDLATVAESVGCIPQAAGLRAIGASWLTAADRYVAALQERIGDSI